jgi:hypothetical protein
MSPEVPVGICEGVGVIFPHGTRRMNFFKKYYLYRMERQPNSLRVKGDFLAG